MIEEIIPMLQAPGMAFAGGFLGSWCYFLIFCPNKRCCRSVAVREVCEHG